jgi:long-chain acyl-CoA synthetase
MFERAATHPEGIALDDFERRRSWAELEARVARLARWLRGELGIAQDGHAACLVGNRVEAVELVLAATVSGIWLTPVNRHLKPDEVAHVVADSGASVVFADPDHEATARAAGAKRVVRVGPELDAALAALPDAPPDPRGPAGGTMIYTSGTSGRPKGVKRRRAASAAEALAAGRAYGRQIGLDGSGPHLVTGPTYHAAPLMFAVYDLWNGAPVVILPRWDERACLAALEQRGIHHTHLVPTHFVRLLRLPDAERAAFRAPELHVALHGAAPISPAVKRRMIEWWGPILVEYWGGTEGGVTTLIDSKDWLAHPGSVGRALPAFEVFAVDADSRRLPPDGEGLLYARHKSLARLFEYHGDPAKTDAAYLDPHSFTLGDVGRVDAEGYVHLADRLSHTIISGGVNVYPAEIEAVLIEHPAVADAAVFGVPDEEWGESVKAAVELRPGFTPGPELAAALLAFVRERLAGYKVPRSIDFEAELPRHPTGKLHVRELRDRHWRGRERQI